MSEGQRYIPHQFQEKFDPIELVGDRALSDIYSRFFVVFFQVFCE